MPIETARARFTDRLNENLPPAAIGIAVRSLRSEAELAATSNGLGARALWSGLGISIAAILVAAASFRAGGFGRRDALMLSAGGMVVGAIFGWGICGLLVAGLRGAWPEASLTIHPSLSALMGILGGGAVAFVLFSTAPGFLTRRVGQAALAVIGVALIGWTAYQYFDRSAQTASIGTKDGTGGFSLTARTALPVVHDPSGAEDSSRSS